MSSGEELDILQSLGQSECSVSTCRNILEDGDGIMLQTCLHPFCRLCLVDIIKKSEDYQIPCPEGSDCGGYLLLREIRAILTPEDFLAYCLRCGHDVTNLIITKKKKRKVEQSNTCTRITRATSRRVAEETAATEEFMPVAPAPSSSTSTFVDDTVKPPVDIPLAPNNVSEDDLVKLNPKECVQEDKVKPRVELPLELNNLPDDDLNIMLSPTECDCNFCYETMKPWDGIALQMCTHIFCRNCLLTSIQNSKDSQIDCLLQEETNCGGFLLDREIKTIAGHEVYEAYKEKSQQSALECFDNIFQCKFEGCSAKCWLDDVSSKIFLCPVCNSKNCIECKTIHDGLECEEYQKLLSNAIASGKDLTIFHKELDKELTQGFDQLAKKIATLKATSSPSKRISNDFTNVLKAMASETLILTTKEFDCIICFESVPIGKGIILQECMHCFCRQCMIGVVRECDDPQVKCPFQDGNYSCTSFMAPREIKALVPPDLYEKYLKRSIQLAENVMMSFHCKTTDCTGWCEIEDEHQPGTFWCYVCKKPNCFKCKAIHGGITCEDYQNELVQDVNNIASQNALNDLVTKGEGMKCPTCKVIVQKTVGCDWLVCSLCKTELCWATKGPRWGPKGRNDVSGGCRCKLNGKYCTPTCQNCH